MHVAIHVFNTVSYVQILPDFVAHWNTDYISLITTENINNSMVKLHDNKHTINNLFMYSENLACS